MHVQKLEFSLWFSRRAPLIEKYAYPRAKLRRGSDRTGRPWSNGRCVIELCSTVDRGENGRVRLKFITRSCHFTLRSSFQNIEFHPWCAISPFYLSPRYFNFFTFALKTKWEAANVNVRMKCCSYWNTNSSLEGERKLERRWIFNRGDFSETDFFNYNCDRKRKIREGRKIRQGMKRTRSSSKMWK